MRQHPKDSFFPSAHLTKNLPSSTLTGTSNTNTKPYFMSHIMDTHTKATKVNNLMLFVFFFSQFKLYLSKSSHLSNRPISNCPFSSTVWSDLTFSIKLEYIYMIYNTHTDFFHNWGMYDSFNIIQSDKKILTLLDSTP